MHLEQLRHCLESSDQARPLLHTWNLHDYERGQSNLAHIADSIGLDGLRDLCHPLGRLLPRCPDPDMALNNLERYLSSPDGLRQLPALFESRARPLEKLLQMLSTSQSFSDILVMS